MTFGMLPTHPSPPHRSGAPRVVTYMPISLGPGRLSTGRSITSPAEGSVSEHCVTNFCSRYGRSLVGDGIWLTIVPLSRRGPGRAFRGGPWKSAPWHGSHEMRPACIALLAGYRSDQQ